LQKKVLNVILIFFTFTSSYLFPQSTESNFKIVLTQLSNIIEKKVAPKLDSTSEYYFEFTSPSEYGILKNVVIAAIKKGHIKISTLNNGVKKKILFSIENISTNYSQPFRDYFWEPYLMKRIISLAGTYSIYNSGVVSAAENFKTSKTDTVAYNAKNIIESPSFIFTRGLMPEPPLFTGLFEPIIAITAILISVYLLFSVRSK